MSLYTEVYIERNSFVITGAELLAYLNVSYYLSVCWRNKV